MIRNLLRAIGIGCLLAGGILYVTSSDEESAGTDVRQMKEQIAQLQSELATAKQELAIAQTTSSVDANQKREANGSLPNEDPASSSGHYVLTIEPGANSTVVSAALERAGMIENADEFNAYLTRIGLASKIQIGDHEIDSSMDHSAIARKITKPK
jgi:outer membrane murein-binding lipoprotein Lpp